MPNGYIKHRVQQFSTKVQWINHTEARTYTPGLPLTYSSSIIRTPRAHNYQLRYAYLA